MIREINLYKQNFLIIKTLINDRFIHSLKLQTGKKFEMVKVTIANTLIKNVFMLII